MTGFLARLRETAHLMVGLPSYAAYLRHMAERHPERTPMSETDFFRDRQEARYGGKNGGRCC
ncbi:MAG: YbdD/YjiX family protein [Sphingosinicella sp.]|nr:YbdD/YjiX family protein [Sphingosinicella sp.]